MIALPNTWYTRGNEGRGKGMGRQRASPSEGGTDTEVKKGWCFISFCQNMSVELNHKLNHEPGPFVVCLFRFTFQCVSISHVDNINYRFAGFFGNASAINLILWGIFPHHDLLLDVLKK